MAKQIQSRIAWLENDQRTGIDNCNFGSSFQPIFTLLRCFGVDVQWGEQRSQLRQNLARFGCVLWSFINIATIIIWTENEIKRGKEIEKEIPMLIDISSAWLQCLAIYFACVLAACQHGRRLTKAFERLETHFPNDQNLHDKIRRASFVTVAIVVIAVN